MKTLNKSLLAAAVIGAIALPGLSSAANLQYVPATTQFIYAQELIATNGNIIDLPVTLTLIAQAASASEALNVNAINAGDRIRVKIALVGGAEFSSTPTAGALAAAFLEGNQTGGGGVALGGAVVPGTAGFTNNNSDLTFDYLVTGGGVVTNDYFLRLAGVRLTNLVSSLGAGGNVVASVDVFNVTTTSTVFTSSAVIASATWGTRIIGNNAGTSDAPLAFVGTIPNTTDKVIDVGSLNNRKTRYAPTGAIGSSNPATTAGASYFNAGGFQVDITSTGANPPVTGYVWHSFGIGPYNLVSSPVSTFTVTVSGNDFSPWVGGGNPGIWLTQDNACRTTAGFNPVNLTVNATTNTATSPALNVTHPLFVNLANINPTPTPLIYVCFGANSTTELIPQLTLSGSIATNHNLPGLRVNPPNMNFRLAPLLMNGTTVLFQNVNPAGTPTAQSFLRLTNSNTTDCPVFIDAKDDAGLHSGTVSLTLAPHTSKQLNSNILENGGDAGVTGTFRDGTGKWYVRILAECGNFTASALNRNINNGTVTDLTPQVGGSWTTPPNPVP